MRSDISRPVSRNVVSSHASIWPFFHQAVVECSLSLVLMTGGETGSVYRESLSQDNKQTVMMPSNKHYKKGMYRVRFPGTEGQGGSVAEVTFVLGRKRLVRYCEPEKVGQGHYRKRQGAKAQKYLSATWSGQRWALSSLVMGGLDLV